MKLGIEKGRYAIPEDRAQAALGVEPSEAREIATATLPDLATLP